MSEKRPGFVQRFLRQVLKVLRPAGARADRDAGQRLKDHQIRVRERLAQKHAEFEELDRDAGKQRFGGE